MFRYKKIAAFVMSVVLCASAVSMTVAFAHGDHDHSEEATEIATEASTEAATDPSDWSVSGDFKYSLNSKDEVCIEGYSGTEKNLILPEELDGKPVTEIGSGCFTGSAIESLEIHKGISYIAGENPFIDCKSLKSVNVSADNENYSSENGILFSKDKTELLLYPSGKTETSYEIPETVETLGIAALYSTNLTELKIPSSVKEIKRHAVSYNEKLVSADMSESGVTILEDMAFAGCTALTSVKFPEGLLEIASGVFAQCSSLEAVELPERLLAIGQNAFAATAMKKAVIPESVTYIGYCAFGYDADLNPIDTFIIVGAQGSAAQTYATDTDEDYDYANNFTFMTFEQNESSIDFDEVNLEHEAFLYSTKDGKVYITACTSGESTVTVPAEINGMPVVSIYMGAFFRSSALSVVLPESLETIDELAFYMCSDLKSISIPEGVTTLGNEAFLDCTALESVTIPASCQSIGEETFLGCSNLKEIIVNPSEGASYFSESGVLFSGDRKKLLVYPASKEDKKYTVPSQTEEIGVSAFIYSKNLESVDLSSVTLINNFAFEGCTALNEVKFSKDLKKIGTAAFYDCKKLKKVRLYDKIEEIGSVALGFYYDPNAVQEATTSEMGIEATTEDSAAAANVKVEGFKIYASKDSGGHRYAQITGLECDTNSVGILGANVNKGFLYTIISVITALIAAVAIRLGLKKSRAKKEEKLMARAREAAAQKLRERAEKTENEAEASEGKDRESKNED